MSFPRHQNSLKRLTPIHGMGRALLAFVLTLSAVAAQSQERQDPDFVNDVQPVLNKHCVGCHNADDLEGGLDLGSFAALSAGGDSGPAVVASDAAGSRLWRLTALGMEPKMPPDDLASPSAEELEVLRRWIEAGATGPDGSEPRPGRLIVPNIPAAPDARSAITAAAWSPDGEAIALARYGKVEVLDARSSELRFSITDLPGKVNSVSFSADGSRLLTASGVTGLSGRADLWNTEDGSLIRSFEGHRDAMLAAALSPDQMWLATAGYDRSILIWNVAEDSLVGTLAGHNGAVYSLAFDPSSKLLLSASADQTLKVWQVATGERLDTLGQPLKEQFCGLFSAHGDAMFGAGADNRIRRWELVSRDSAAINPLQQARFAHEGSIVALAVSADGRFLASSAEDRTVKFWRASDLAELAFRPNQSDIVSAIAFDPSGEHALLARLDGSWDIKTFPTGAREDREGSDVATPAPMAPMNDFNEIAEAEPNDGIDSAAAVALPARISGVVSAREDGADLDLFGFD
ncbi:MAG: hypothetical protein KDA83_21095, partial [Planctomycetales bacterium]|nr:hypothetical protein [Planctomycetales bacterium]